MLRFAIADDDPTDRQQLQAYLEQYRKESGKAIEITAFSDGDELLEQYRCQFDLILLDVEMRFLDGMTAAQQIRRMDPEVIIIFISNMAQYAIQGYSVEALDYVLKPVSYFTLSQRLNRAIQRMGRREKVYLTISVKGGSVKLEVGGIYYVESRGNQLIYHTASGDHTALSKTIQQAEEELGKMNFFRSNKGYLVNLEHVDGVRDGCAIVKGERLVISRRRAAAFLEALANYVSGVSL